ncbi:MAG: protein-L-isoaspartate O-methyltransferase, partial [Achromobacter piechaudii]
MRKRVSQPDVSQAVPGRPSPVRYDSGRLSPGVTATNSNTRISAATLPRQAQAPAPSAGSNLGLNSDRLRQA